MKLSDENLRGLANAGQLYDDWKDVMASLSQLPGGMYWRVISSKEYLYQYASTAGRQQTKYVGRKTPDVEETYRDFQQKKKDLEERRQGIEKRITELAPAWRALRLPAIDTTAGNVLRAFDQVNFVGKSMLVIGTYALKAYEVEAATSFSAGMDATEDLDFTLFADAGNADPDLPRRLLLTLKQVDSSFIVTASSPKTVVNKNGYRIDLLISKAVAEIMASSRPWKPEALDGQEWLLLGKPVHAVLIDYQGWPVAISAPDPRYFALHKLWLSKRRGRSPIKAPKDRNQGEALLKVIKEHMPHYPMDGAFVAGLPGSLGAEYEAFTRGK
jgi:hypothetical protein